MPAAVGSAYTDDATPPRCRGKERGVDVALDATGISQREAAAKHLEAGAKKVIHFRAADGADLTSSMGVTNDSGRPTKHEVISNASCTTTAWPRVRLWDPQGHRHSSAAIWTTINSYTATRACRTRCTAI